MFFERLSSRAVPDDWVLSMSKSYCKNLHYCCFQVPNSVPNSEKYFQERKFCRVLLSSWFFLFHNLTDISITNFERETDRERDIETERKWFSWYEHLEWKETFEDFNLNKDKVVKSPFLGLIYVHIALIFIILFFLIKLVAKSISRTYIFHVQAMNLIVKCFACSTVSAWNIFPGEAGYNFRIKSIFTSSERNRVATWANEFYERSLWYSTVRGLSHGGEKKFIRGVVFKLHTCVLRGTERKTDPACCTVDTRDTNSKRRPAP